MVKLAWGNTRKHDWQILRHGCIRVSKNKRTAMPFREFDVQPSWRVS